MGRIVIEINDGKNRSFLWQPSGEQVRGRYSRHNFYSGAVSTNGILKMPDIPGHQVILDTTHKRGCLHDPLNEEQHKDLLAEAQEIHRQCKRVAFATVSDRVTEDMPEEVYNSWIYWMKRLVSQNQATVIEGEDLLRKPIKGPLRKNTYDMSHDARKDYLGNEIKDPYPEVATSQG